MGLRKPLCVISSGLILDMATSTSYYASSLDIVVLLNYKDKKKVWNYD